MKVPYDVVLPQVNVLGSTMAYRETGNPEAPVALFLHGNPTSSYVWRNVLPLVAPVAHCIAPDLIGFGQSGKPDIEYRFADHVRYVDAFLDRTGISRAFVIAQDWGTALAFHLAAAGRSLSARLPSWSSSGHFLHGMTFTRLQSRPSRSSGHRESAKK